MYIELKPGCFVNIQFIVGVHAEKFDGEEYETHVVLSNSDVIIIPGNVVSEVMRKIRIARAERGRE